MNKRRMTELVAGLALLTAGCDALLNVLLPSTFMVSFVNESPDFAVELTMSSAEDEDTPESAIILLGDERNITLAAGATVTRTFGCDAIGALMIEDAELQSGLLQPDTSSDVVRQGADFSCGGHIVFTFTHSEVLIDFDVSISSGPV